MTDAKSDAEILYGRGEAENPAPGTSRIELCYWPVVYNGHAFLRRVNADGSIEELHGFPASRNPDTSDGDKRPLEERINDEVPPERAVGDGARLMVRHEAKPSVDNSNYKPSHRVAILVSGSSGEIDKIWQRGREAGDALNKDKGTFDYKAYDLSFPLGGNGGQIQNSNSAIYTVGRAMKLNLDGVVERAGVARKLPGWGRDLFDPKNERFVASDQFPVQNAP